MKMSAQEANEILETLALSHAADKSQHGLQHGSRIARIEVNSWHADKIRNSEVSTANNPAELRALMENPDAAVIFLPQTAMVTAEIIERICAEAPLNKMIIWETNT
jgi:hypothetical protein